MAKNQLAIKLSGITKQFPGVLANDNIDLEVEKGEVHALIGENGAGKSTLMSILFGHLQPTSGTIEINGKKRVLKGPDDANNLGLGMVHQHFKLVDTYTVLENIVLGSEPTKLKYFVSLKNARIKLNTIAEKYNLRIDPDMLIQNSTVGQQQRTEILKILYNESDILIFDEPTAVLTPQEIEGFLETIKNFKKLGKTVIIITHKLDEVKAVADRATVIRRGQKIATVDVKTATTTKMAELMVGRKLVSIKNKPTKNPNAKTILKMSNVNVKHHDKKGVLGLKNFNLDIKEGEIVAIAGVEGNGQLELANAISGLQKYSGNITFNGVSLNNKSIKYRNLNKMSFVPEDRYKYAMVEQLDLNDNAVFKKYWKQPFAKYGFINKSRVNKYAMEIIEKFDVRGARAGYATIGSLSGGNQQKMIVGREMTEEHNLIILFQPTRGLDIGAIEFIHSQIIKEKEAGKAVLLISYELSEVMAMADKIVVVNAGNKVAEVVNKDISRNEIGLMMAGISKEAKGAKNG